MKLNKASALVFCRSALSYITDMTCSPKQAQTFRQCGASEAAGANHDEIVPVVLGTKVMDYHSMEATLVCKLKLWTLQKSLFLSVPGDPEVRAGQGARELGHDLCVGRLSGQGHVQS